ncbi:putative ribonuclease H-like domain-containing protein, partial [Tanacetum coccineum]
MSLVPSFKAYNATYGNLELTPFNLQLEGPSLLDHKIQQLSKGSSEGSGITPEVPDEPKDNSAVVAEKQARYVQTNLTLSSAELEIQSMVDVPIHQEDLAVQRTPLIDPVISMVTEKTASTPTPPTTQAHVLSLLIVCGATVIVTICETLSLGFFADRSSCYNLLSTNQAGFLEPRGGGKKNNKNGEQPVGKKINTIVTGGASNTRPILVINIVKENEGSNASGINNGDSTRKGLNFRTLITSARNGIDVVVSLESIRVISQRFGKYGLVKSMLNCSIGLFFFQFSFMHGLDAMLENEYIGNVPVWVKLHGVPVTAFNKDGLSAIATKLGTPLMLDSYTSHMCMQSYGRSSYDRAMIEIQADVELKDTIMVAMPKLVGEGF